MNYSAIVSASCVDFSGWSTVLQVTGCHFGCSGCFNTKAQSPKYGEEFTEDTYKTLIEYASKPFIQNIVIMGGEPLFHHHLSEMITLLRRLRNDLPNKKLVVFSGFTYEEITLDVLRSPVLDVLNYLVDGKFMKNLPTDKCWRGSSNQVIHELENGVSIKQM